MKPALRVQNVSKCYRVGTRTQWSPHTLTDTLRTKAADAWRKLAALAAPASEPTGDDLYWAVNDVSFEVERGEAVGLIGRNGAGKSTLFKLLSRITEPTRGRIEVRGRLCSLLEVGTGFHAELTGRENVYLNGSILGMTRREINAKFDRIVEFSEVGRFLDTPVKRYSSGMFVRLAFAVAAHLEPDIMIVDEVLAVGDATFQKRCLDRMKELATSGATVLFVSHNMQQIPRLCDRAVLMDRGRVLEVGPAADIVKAYTERLLTAARTGDLTGRPRTGDGRAKFVRAELDDPAGRVLSVITCGDDLTVRMEVDAAVPLTDACVQVVLHTPHGLRLVTGWTREAGFPLDLRVGRTTLTCRFRAVPLRPGQTVMLGLTLTAGNGAVLDAVENAAVYDVIGDDRHGHLSTNPDQGAVVCEYDWSRPG